MTTAKDVADDRPAVCPHGTSGGAEPDPFVGGRLSCPLCRAEAGQGVDPDEYP